MTLAIAIENYRGIKAAAFNLEGIVMIAAKNAAGKSAVAQASAAVLTGTPIPIPGVLKTMAGMLVRMGAASGFAQLDCEHGTARVDWPKASMKSKGDMPNVSAIVAGIESLPRMEQKQRAERLIEILNAHPTKEDVRKRLAREGISEQIADNVWQTVEKQGWDGAHAQAKETGARLKGQWEAVTGKRYGSRIAENFVPDEWDQELASESEESLTAKLTDARDTLDGMIAVVAVDDSERAKLEEIAAALPEKRAAHAAATAAFADAVSERDKIAAHIRSMRDPSAQAHQECPHCAGSLSVFGGKVVAATAVSEHEKSAWDEVHSRYAVQKDLCERLLSERGNAISELKSSLMAHERLASIANANSSQEQVEKARQAVRLATSRLSAFTSKTRADRLQSSILQNGAIVSTLDTSGVRQDALIDAAGRFVAAYVKPLIDASGWEQIEIQPDLALFYGGRPWALLSESERYRVCVAMQVAVAVKQKSEALIIDAADILDREGRNGLINMLRDVGIPALVCVTIPSLKDVPDLGAKGLGASYWIRDGLVMPISVAKEKEGSSNNA